MSLPIGKVRLTADGVVLTSGANIRVYGVVLKSDGGGATTAVLRQGTTDEGTAMDEITTGGADSIARVSYAGGILFEGGCFLDVGTNHSYAVIICEKEK